MQGTPESKDAPREKQESVSPLPPAVTPPSIYVLSKSTHALNMNIDLQTTTSTLLDSGTTGMCVNQAFVQKHRLETCPLPNPVPVHNVDRTLNENGSITEEVEVILQYGWHMEKARLTVANLG